MHVCSLLHLLQARIMSAGNHRHLPEAETQMQVRGAKLNPTSIPKRERETLSTPRLMTMLH